MNIITKAPISSLGYQFIPQQYLPKGKDEYYLREKQNPKRDLRKLTENEIEALIKNGNNADDWNKIFVSEKFYPELIKNNQFFGLVTIGNIEPVYLEYNSIKLPVGIYNSTIISSDIGNDNAIHNANYISHYIIGNEVFISNVNELATTNFAKFGNGILKIDEQENIRIQLELCNENAGRPVLPFDGMQAGDAFLWSRNRDNSLLQQRFKELTDNRYSSERGFYGTIGDRTVIKNCKIIKDVKIGSDAYLKGANKLKNLTINSSPDTRSQIGEGVELVNGIVGFGCRIFYGVKAVRFILGNHSQLKYGARLINSYLAENSTISCCEVLNSLIFPAHEQHHNNSFLCATTVLGQSNLAAGATIGSNHNSRAADGEIVAGRGFWPGLCVSLKHNCRFASFALLAKGNYPHELNIPFPFALISNDEANDSLNIMPAYWMMYNMYALSRNADKTFARDKRTTKDIFYEYNYLAPDTVNEMFDALKIISLEIGKLVSQNPVSDDDDLIDAGKNYLSTFKNSQKGLEVFLPNIENSTRKVKLLKPEKAATTYQDMILIYAVQTLFEYFETAEISNFDSSIKALKSAPRQAWENIGGQLILSKEVSTLKQNIETKKINSWDEVHSFYINQSKNYSFNKAQHALASMLELLNISFKKFTPQLFATQIKKIIPVIKITTDNIYESRKKDYENPFKQMVYDNDQEMEAVLGSLSNNEFILKKQKEAKSFIQKANKLYKNLMVEQM